jgi:MOSC domain-containing protein YiiM
MPPHIATIQVGLPQTLGSASAPHPMDRPWVTGFFKTPIQGEVWLSKTNLAGDGQADLNNHGGPDKAVLAYNAGHYPYWRSHLQRPDLPYGAFGENFTVVGQTEEDVCIGDIYGIGTATVQVSQPRQPCWKLSRRWRIEDLAQQVIANGRSGWYLRVLNPGIVQPGLTLGLQARPYPQWPVALAHSIMHHRLQPPAATLALADCEALSANWRAKLPRRANPT